MVDIYRAKVKDSGQWVEGLPYRDLNKTREFVWFIQVYKKNNNSETCESYEVDESTLCRTTGEKDKKGNTIWESDILMAHGNKLDLAKVSFGKFNVTDAESYDWVDTVTGWYYQPIHTDKLSKTIPYCLPMPLTASYIDLCEFEVVGNVFDTPDLLKSLVQKKLENMKKKDKADKLALKKGKCIDE